MDMRDDTDNLHLLAHFGTTSPYWRLTHDSNALQLSSEQAGPAPVAVRLTPEQAQSVRTMSGVTSSQVLDVSFFGESFKLHLVGRKIDELAWGGTAAQYGDTETVDVFHR